MNSPVSLEQLVNLARRRWAIPVVAMLFTHRGCRFAPLWRGLRAAPGAIRQTLDWLIERGLVARATGYGHPLRPEYVLTEAGEEIGPWAVRVEHFVEAAGAPECLRDVWSLPLLALLARADRRFSELAARLPGITDRALSIALRDLERAGLVRRSVLPTRPPGVLYSAEPARGSMARYPIIDWIDSDSEEDSGP